ALQEVPFGLCTKQHWHATLCTYLNTIFSNLPYHTNLQLTRNFNLRKEQSPDVNTRVPNIHTLRPFSMNRVSGPMHLRWYPCSPHQHGRKNLPYFLSPCTSHPPLNALLLCHLQ
ncbi:unnamed protein product, partial [Ectocarpus sp. 12 AP-2014]